MLLSKEAILAAQDLKSEDVDVPEWGGTVRVRMMTGTERDAFGAALLGKDGKPDMVRYRIQLLAACVVGDDGQPMFGTGELGGKSGTVLARLADVAERLNAVDAKALETAEGN